jgi:hypothetical protein
MAACMHGFTLRDLKTSRGQVAHTEPVTNTSSIQPAIG